MKKLLVYVTIIALMVSLVACGEKKTIQPRYDDFSVEETSDSSVTVDEGLLDVEITLPASLFGGEDMGTFDTDEYIEETGAESATVNPDGSITIKMTKDKYKEMIEETKQQTLSTINEYIESEDTPYVKAIETSADFEEITIDVIKSEYDNAFDLTPFVVGFSVLMYKMIAGGEQSVTIIMRDYDTGVVFDTINYPDDMDWSDE